MRNNQSRTGRRSSPPQSAPVQNSLAYTVPTEFVELPPRGRFYPKEHPLHDQETIEIRFMTAKDEDILSSTALLKKGLAIDRLLESLIVVDIDPSTIIIGDRNAIMIAARISSYGAGYDVNLACPKCDSKVSYSFDLKKTNLNNECFDQGYLDEYNVKFNEEACLFEVELPNSEVTVGVRMLDGQDEKDLLNIDEDHSITSMLSAIVASVGADDNPVAVASFVENMPASDSKFLRSLYSILAPNIDLKQGFVCEVCFERKDMEVPLTAEFFWPG